MIPEAATEPPFTRRGTPMDVDAQLRSAIGLVVACVRRLRAAPPSWG